MANRRPPRLPTFTYTGFNRYFLTLCTYRRRHRFAADDVVESVLAQMRRAALMEKFAVIAYCFMPDHAHLLVEGRREDADLRRFVSRFKQRSGFRHRRLFQANLWQGGYYERVLRGEEDTASVASYVLLNPVRAKLVEDARSYRWSGSDVMSVGQLLVEAGYHRDRPPRRPARSSRG